VFYLEDEEWIELGGGSIKITDGRFIFIRDSFKTVLLNFNCKRVPFVEEDGCIRFTAKSRKSTERGFEIVDREYKIDFDQKESISQFLDAIKNIS
jgi:hypothetical protein